VRSAALDTSRWASAMATEGGDDEMVDAEEAGAEGEGSEQAPFRHQVGACGWCNAW